MVSSSSAWTFRPVGVVVAPMGSMMTWWLFRALRHPKRKLIFGTPKSHATRSVPITVSLAHELEKLLEDRSPDAPLFAAPGGNWLQGALTCMNKEWALSGSNRRPAD